MAIQKLVAMISMNVHLERIRVILMPTAQIIVAIIHVNVKLDIWVTENYARKGLHI